MIWGKIKTDTHYLVLSLGLKISELEIKILVRFEQQIRVYWDSMIQHDCSNVMITLIQNMIILIIMFHCYKNNFTDP